MSINMYTNGFKIAFGINWVSTDDVLCRYWYV